MSNECAHGQLKRSCNYCEQANDEAEYEATIAKLQAELKISEAFGHCQTIALDKKRVELMARDKGNAYIELGVVKEENAMLREALTKLRDCDWVVSLPDRMDSVRDIAREALEGVE